MDKKINNTGLRPVSKMGYKMGLWKKWILRKKQRKEGKEWKKKDKKWKEKKKWYSDTGV